MYKLENVKENPIFIICIARTGSTLLRYILDTHDDIYCPPEPHLIELIEELNRLYRILYIDDPICRNPQVFKKVLFSRIRENIDRIMRSFFKEKNKIWCDKSVSTIRNVQLVREVYPTAKYICLYRHCMDFVHSAIEVSKHGLVGCNFGDFCITLSDHTNVVDSLVKFWCDNTAKMLWFETESRRHTHRVKYESIILDPEKACFDLFRFIGLPFDKTLVDEIFMREHQPGPGDFKINYTRKIEKTSLRKGYHIPIEKVNPQTLRQMNLLLERLEYETVEDDWNSRAHPNLIYRFDSTDWKETEKQLAKIFEEDFSGTIKKKGGKLLKKGVNCKFFIKDGDHPAAWLISDREPFFKRVGENTRADCTVILGAETLFKVVNKELNIWLGLHHGLIKIEGSLPIAHSLTFLFG